MAKLRVVQVSKHFHPYSGGLESNVLSVSLKLVERDVAVSCVTSHEPGFNTKSREDFQGIGVYRSQAFFTLFNALFTPGVLVDLMRLDYDLIHVHLPDPFNSFSAYIASVLKNKPLIVTYHSDIVKGEWYHLPFKFLYAPVFNLILRRAVYVITTSPNYAESSKALEGFRSKVKVIPNPVDVSRFRPDVDGTGVRARYNITGKKVVLFVGRLVPYKGVEYLIKAFSGVRSKVKDAFLLIVGDGLLRRELMRLVLELNLNDAVVFAGKVPDKELPEYYVASDVFVLPSVSKQEAFGVALLEAMASGKPVITTNIRGSGTSYVAEGCGIVVKPENAKELEEGIVGMLKNPDVASDYGRKGRYRSEKEFDINIICDMLLEAYGKAVSNARV